MDNVIVTTVAVTGSAETHYDLATFSLSLVVNDATVPAAKARLKEKIAVLDEEIKLIFENHQLKIVKDMTASSVNVQPKYNWENNRNVQDGFQATYYYQFQTESMDKINQVNEELSSLHEVTVNAVISTLKNSDRLNKKALKNAWKKISERFADECDVFGLLPENYEILNWTASYADTPRPIVKKGSRDDITLALDDEVAGKTASVNLIVNMAKVTVTVNVSFKKKI